MSEKYSELRWHLPPYFKDSLAKCRFEQGTVIYKDKPLGENWREEINNIDYLIQVLYPPATIGVKSAMLSHWDSEVIFEFFYPKTKEKKVTKTTQGRLFTFLWKDNLEIFYDTKPLLPPLTKIDVKSIDKKFFKEKIPFGNVGFVLPYNPINDILVWKLNEIKKLSSKYDFEELTFSIEESCIIRKTEKDYEIYPLLKTKLLLYRNARFQEVYELIKSAVYKGTKDKFSIETHGILINR